MRSGERRRKNLVGIHVARLVIGATLLVGLAPLVGVALAGDVNTGHGFNEQIVALRPHCYLDPATGKLVCIPELATKPAL